MMTPEEVQRLQKIAEITVRKFREQTEGLSPYITVRAMESQVGKTVVKMAIESGELNIIQFGGKTSPKKALIDEFERLKAGLSCQPEDFKAIRRRTPGIIKKG